ncbi:PrsW family intramembrane metalloprotease [bacterium]|nr:PrsW family intramembrane metalloprotease [bacterium]
MDFAFEPVIVALAGGFFPSLAWLWFWRREDREHPEPRYLIALAFLGGMLTVACVIPLQKAVAPLIPTTTLLFTVWSAIEEVCKYLSARITVLWRRDDDEPIDPVIYMIATALGFAALENTLFLLSPLAGNSLRQTIITGDLRFVGATLLHVLSSSIIGCALGIAFYKSRVAQFWWLIAGILSAIAVHSTFNYLILNVPEAYLVRTFSVVWISLIVVFAVLEYIKRIHPRS